MKKGHRSPLKTPVLYKTKEEVKKEKDKGYR